MPEKKTAFWAGHPLLTPKDSEPLELAAAVNEFHHGMDRESAEKHALDEYRREHHARAAAHHLMGMRAAQASGSHDDAKKHYDMYGLHLKALGHETHEAVPGEVKRYTEGENVDRAYHFKGHGADQFLVNTVKKSEVPGALLQYFVTLAKAAGPDRFELLDMDDHPAPEEAFKRYPAQQPKAAPAAPRGRWP
jgi:hypothetical protein